VIQVGDGRFRSNNSAAVTARPAHDRKQILRTRGRIETRVIRSRSTKASSAPPRANRPRHKTSGHCRGE
jgi:hypothetical protein